MSETTAVSKIPAKKIGMTSGFDGSGTTLPLTLLQPEPVVVTEIKRPETHGYSAVQLAYGECLPRKVGKPIQGIFNKAGVDKTFRYFYEVRLKPEELEKYELGQILNPTDFVGLWEEIAVTAISKGKGFAGAMKRWGFAGQARTHGDPDNRRPMSNGATDPARVFKGSKRPGRMGNEKVTVGGLTMFEFNKDLNVIAVSGSVPGPKGNTVFVSMKTMRDPAEVAAEAEE